MLVAAIALMKLAGLNESKMAQDPDFASSAFCERMGKVSLSLRPKFGRPHFLVALASQIAKKRPPRGVMSNAGGWRGFGLWTPISEYPPKKNYKTHCGDHSEILRTV